jgi:hypothetical protein
MDTERVRERGGGREREIRERKEREKFFQS